VNGREGRLRDSLWLSLLPRGLRFESQLAVRHLRSGGRQTLLTISAVAAGVIIVVFVTALIFGLQRRWTNILTDALPHVTIRVVDPKPMPLATVPGAPSGVASSRIEQSSPQQKNIENWASYRSSSAMAGLVRRSASAWSISESALAWDAAWRIIQTP